MKTQTTTDAAQHNSQPHNRDFEHLDLGPIMVKLTSTQHGKGWSHEKAQAVAIQYRRFLTLVRENPNTTIVPTEAIDEFWHTHILDTMKYSADCDEYFGFYVHHFPYLGLRGDADEKRLAAGFENTKNLYEARFGESLLPANGKLSAADCSAGCGGVVCSPGTCSADQRPEYNPHKVAA